MFNALNQYVFLLCKFFTTANRVQDYRIIKKSANLKSQKTNSMIIKNQRKFNDKNTKCFQMEELY